MVGGKGWLEQGKITRSKSLGGAGFNVWQFDSVSRKLKKHAASGILSCPHCPRGCLRARRLMMLTFLFFALSRGAADHI
jgi:hypothetical protein